MIGKLRNLVQIKTIEKTPNGSGGFKSTYVDYSDVVDFYVKSIGNATLITSDTCDFLAEFLTDTYVWASINQRDGVRGLTGSKIDLDNYTEFVFRYEDMSNIQKDWLLVYEGRKFTIHSYYVVQERKKYIVVKALESK